MGAITLVLAGSFFFGHTVASGRYAGLEVGVEHVVAISMMLTGVAIALGRPDAGTSGGLALFLTGAFFFGHTIASGKYASFEVGIEHAVAGCIMLAGAALILCVKPSDATPEKRRRSKESLSLDAQKTLDLSPSAPRRHAPV